MEVQEEASQKDEPAKGVLSSPGPATPHHGPQPSVRASPDEIRASHAHPASACGSAGLFQPAQQQHVVFHHAPGAPGANTHHHGPTTSGGMARGDAADSLIGEIPPPLPIPGAVPMTGNASLAVAGAFSSSSAGSHDLAHLAGVSAMHGQMGIQRSNSRASELGHGGGRRRSPDKGLDARALGLPVNPNHPRLKVEDALGYLDRVKVIFNHSPKVYNDFLDIMKEFKSQSLDTPGVITRVASLFHGHGDLIVGFNAFLPHGYQIEIDAFGIVKVSVPNNQVINITEMMPPQPSSSSSLALEYANGPAVKREKSPSPTSTVSAESDDDTKMEMDLPDAGDLLPRGSEEPQQQLSQMDILCSTAGYPKGPESESGRQSSRSSGHQTSKGVEFDYAINYVNKIKGRFQDQPHKYKRFLEILHDYQGKLRAERPLDETDVYKEVGRLFGEHPDLMNDFSRFLPNACATIPGGPRDTPPGVGSTRSTSPSRSDSSSPALAIKSSKSQGGRSSGKKGDKSVQQRRGGESGKKSGSCRGQKSQDTKSPRSGGGGKLKQAADEHGESGRLKGGGGGGKKFSRPQAKDLNGRGGRMPDIVPEGPKKPAGRPLYNADKEKEKSERNRAQDLSVAGPSGGASKQSKGGFRRGHEENGSVDENISVKNVKAKKNAYRLAVPVQRKKLKRLLPLKKVFKPTRVVLPAVAFSYATFDDFSLMDRIRRSVPTNVFTVLLKSFELYTSRVLTKGKILELMEKVLYHKPKLVQAFASFLQTKVVARAGADRAVSSANRPLNDSEHRRVVAQKAKDPENRIAEIDFKAFEKYTDSRSYRIRPENLPKPKCTGSSVMDREVLNDRFVSCPIFSEGSQFLISKKNIAEEVMFKCEDEKYEMDMLLAGAEAAIHAMTYQLEMITAAGSAGRMVTWEDAALHRRIIQKLYTENAGIIMAHLKKNPACSLPTVLERLKQKHIQWIRVQNSMSEIWMDQARRNASKIGDYKGATFKQTDMRFLRSRHLVHEMEKLYGERVERQAKLAAPQKPDSQDNSPKIAPPPPVAPPSVENKPHLTVSYPKSALTIDDVSFFILRYVKNHSGFAHSDKKRMNCFLVEYLFRCFKLQDTSNMREFYDSSDDDSDSDDKSPRMRRSCPRLASSSSDEEDTADTTSSRPKRSTDGTDDEAGAAADSGVPPKKARTGAKEFPIAPLPWPELCQYSGEMQPLDSQVDESLSEEARKREKRRERIAYRLASSNPSATTTTAALPADDSRYVLIYGSSPFFLFVRYHQLLCERFAVLYRSFQSVLTVSTGKQEMPAYIVSKTCKPRIDVPVERFWGVFTDRLLKLLDGNIDPVSYEEEMREVFRKDAYLAFTLDRLIQSVARQLHHVVAQERAKTVCNFWEEAWLNGGAGGPMNPTPERLEAEKAYESKVSDFLKDQNCFKITVTDSGKVGMELTDSEEPEDQQPLCRNWKEFVHYHAGAVNLDESLKKALLARPALFIARQHRQLSRHQKHSTREVDEEDEEEEEDMVLDITKLSDQEGGAEFSLDDKSWLMTVNIRSQIESDDILGIREDRVPLTVWKIYRRGAIEAARESHKRVTQRRTFAFRRYLSDVWMKKANITQEKNKAFIASYRENLIREKTGNSVKSPYFVHYITRSEESEQLDDAKPYWLRVPETETEPELEAEADLDHHRQQQQQQQQKDEEFADTAASDSSDDEREDDTETEVEQQQVRRKADPKGSTAEV
ncbi:putative Paired amphipathic helix protein Sin3a [Hypsibius exemplaris]|uniref:Paired amphipathic helix protein Sin3a n=1 Tax=Hypsibius exemplaris TaxID=2072580 RepID=A0A1W0WRF4_HYPEX|nr:putative Paired amphipathic helix protein Sin3a [Hypsibius exemplaris]